MSGRRLTAAERGGFDAALANPKKPRGGWFGNFSDAVRCCECRYWKPNYCGIKAAMVPPLTAACEYGKAAIRSARQNERAKNARLQISDRKAQTRRADKQTNNNRKGKDHE